MPGTWDRSCGLPGGAEGIQTAVLLAMASGAVIHERVDGATSFAVNRLGLAFPAPQGDEGRWSGSPAAVELTLADRTLAPVIRYRLKSEAIAVPESQSDAVAEGVEKVVFAVTFSVANAKALDLVKQVVS